MIWHLMWFTYVWDNYDVPVFTPNNNSIFHMCFDLRISFTQYFGLNFSQKWRCTLFWLHQMKRGIWNVNGYHEIEDFNSRVVFISFFPEPIHFYSLLGKPLLFDANKFWFQFLNHSEWEFRKEFTVYTFEFEMKWKFRPNNVDV